MSLSTTPATAPSPSSSPPRLTTDHRPPTTDHRPPITDYRPSAAFRPAFWSFLPLDFRVPDARKRPDHQERHHRLVCATEHLHQLRWREDLDVTVPVIDDRHRFQLVMVLRQIPTPRRKFEKRVQRSPESKQEKSRKRPKKMVPATGLEPVRCYPLEPESSASANSATRALGNCQRKHRIEADVRACNAEMIEGRAAECKRSLQKSPAPIPKDEIQDRGARQRGT